jgi:hypothetical protein
VLLFLLNYLSPPGSRFLAGASTIICSPALDRPVEDVVILEALTNKQVTEELAKVGVIGLVIEAESMSVVQEDAKFAWEATAVSDLYPHPCRGRRQRQQKVGDGEGGGNKVLGGDGCMPMHGKL